MEIDLEAAALALSSDDLRMYGRATVKASVNEAGVITYRRIPARDVFICAPPLGTEQAHD